MNAHARIKFARRSRGLSQLGLATAVGIQRSAVSHWESPLGKSPTVSNLRKVAEVTGVRFEWLTTGRGPMSISDDDALQPIQAANALWIEDELEMRFIQAFRRVPLASRVTLVEMAEQIAALRGGRERGTNAVAHPTILGAPRGK